MPGRHLQVAGVDIVWEPHLTFIGHVFDFTGNCCAAIHYRTAQARKAYHRWKPLLLSKWLSVKRRVALGSRAVFASLLWLAETWIVIKVQCSKMESWGARLLAQIARVRRGLTEDIGPFWRRMHRTGHKWMRDLSCGISVRRRTQFHRFAGHIARAFDSRVRQVMCTRCLAWWRYHQTRNKSERYGLHPKPFYPRRWEMQLVEYYGEAETNHNDARVGWMLKAESREQWRSEEKSFALL